MIYIFEDHPDADISKLFKSAYNNNNINNFIYAKGNGNLVDKINYYISKTTDKIIVFMDTIPGNKDCYSIYREIRLISIKHNCRVIVLPIICSEYYMIKSIKNKDIFKDREEINRCIMKEPHITSSLMNHKDKASYCRNFEKYCKYLLKYNTVKNCLKNYNKEDNINGEYYNESCKCNKAMSDCIQITLSEKAIALLIAYKYIPSGSIADKVKHLTDDELWDIHRKLVDEYNAFVDSYILVDSNELNKYKKITYIK